MKYLLPIFLLATSFISPQATSLQQFQWLEGKWKLENKDVYELWQTVGDTLMTGVGYHIELVEEVKIDESIRLVKRGETFFYIPRVADQNNGQEVEFKVISLTKNSFVAVNPKHDFPQRISYERKDEKHLHAYIEGKIKGETKRIDYHFIKVKQ